MTLNNVINSLVLGVGIVACAHSPVQLNTEPTTSAIRAADELGAEKVPRAALHLQLAKEGLKSAQDYAKTGKKEKAEATLSKAEADAELSVALLRQDTAATEADQTDEKVHKLQNEGLSLPRDGGSVKGGTP